MKRFERQTDGRLVAELSVDEAHLLQSLAGQVAELIETNAHESTQPTDPALLRLLPNAYPDDAEASAEFRRFTATGLAERKRRNAETVALTLVGVGITGTVSLDEPEAQGWLRSLTDIRLTIAARLGIETDDDTARNDLDPLMTEVYDWLGFVQNSLVEALRQPGGH